MLTFAFPILNNENWLFWMLSTTHFHTFSYDSKIQLMQNIGDYINKDITTTSFSMLPFNILQIHVADFMNKCMLYNFTLSHLNITIVHNVSCDNTFQHYGPTYLFKMIHNKTKALT